MSRTCIHCKEQMKDEAKVCPHCQRGQRALDWRKARSEGVAAAIAAVVVLGALVMAGSWLSPSLGDKKVLLGDDVEVVESSYAFVQGDCGDKLVVIGNLRNGSQSSVRDIEIAVSFYDRDGELIDVVERSMWDTALAGGEERPFRASACPSLDDRSRYADYSIKVLGKQDSE